MSFDVLATERLKRRYYIENVDSLGSETHCLYRINDDTDIKLTDGTASPSISATTAPPLQTFHIDSARIGGIVDQVNQLNRQLKKLCMKVKLQGTPMPTNEHILLHGFEGTGKTMLLDSLAVVQGFNKVIRLTNAELSSTPTRNAALIASTFEQAKSRQPSLILLDDIDDIAPRSDASTSATVNALSAALDRSQGTQILVVAAARSKHNVASSLLVNKRFTKDVELPIPDQQGRSDILMSLLHGGADRATLTDVAAATHGYTGSDLARLLGRAFDLALDRHLHDEESWHTIDHTAFGAPPSTASSANDYTSNGRSGSVATTLVDRPTGTDISIGSGDWTAARQIVRPSALREVIVEPPSISFADIGGSEALHATFTRLIEWPLKYRQLYGSKYKGRRGVLLYGPPGCSKTMTAQAVAKTFGWNFIAIRGAELISMYVGESERALREIFQKARQAAPAIIFFDEIDSIATSRAASADSAKGLNVLTTLLNEMDGFEALSNVMVLAATNRPEILDPAILRSGRFDEHIYLGPPDAHARRAIFEICIREHTEVCEFDTSVLAAESEGMSGAEVRNAWRIAFDRAVERSITDEVALTITQDDVLVGIAATPRSITGDMLAAYEDFGARNHKLK